MDIKIIRKPTGIPTANAAVSAGDSGGSKWITMHLSSEESGIIHGVGRLRMSHAEACALAERLLAEVNKEPASNAPAEVKP